jgi:signal transduction histidine kinase
MIVEHLTTNILGETMPTFQAASGRNGNLHLQEDARFHILSEVIQQITSILDINELLVEVVRLIQKTFDYYHVGIGLVEGEYVVYRVGAGVLWEDPNFGFRPSRLKIGSEGLTGWVAKTGETALVQDVALDPRYVWMKGSLTRSELVVPIRTKGSITGVLDIQSQQEDAFDDDDLELMQVIAGQTGIAIENARLFTEKQHLLKETEQRASELAIINRVQQELASKLEVQSIYDLVGDTFREIFDAQVVMISPYDPQTNTVEHRYAIERGRRVYSPGGHPPGGFRSKIISTKQPVLVNTNVAEEATLLGQPTLPGTDTPKSWLGVPMLVDGQVMGILSVQNLDHENAFRESDVRLLQTFAASMSIALENARLFSHAQHRAEQFRVLTEVSQHLTSILNINELLRQLVLLVQRTFHYYHIEIGLVEGDDVVFLMGAGELWETPGFQAKPSRLKVGQDGITGWVAKSGQTLVIPDVSREPRYINVAGCRTKSELTVPITVKDQVIGILDVESDRLNGFNETDLELMTLLASQAGIAIENARLYEGAKKMAALEERQRLSHELHDSVTQSLYGICLYAQAASGKIDLQEIKQARQYLDDIQNTAQESLADMRLLIYELRPPILEKEGLVAAIHSRLISVEDRAGIRSSLNSSLTGRLPVEVEEGLYQIAREALNNIIKHAHAKNITIYIQENQEAISMKILDDGIGFVPSAGHRQGRLGIASMQERAHSHGWQFSIESSPGNGTCIKVEATKQ